VKSSADTMPGLKHVTRRRGHAVFGGAAGNFVWDESGKFMAETGAWNRMSNKRQCGTEMKKPRFRHNMGQIGTGTTTI
jgi:hypothetical protein